MKKLRILLMMTMLAAAVTACGNNGDDKSHKKHKKDRDEITAESTVPDAKEDSKKQKEDTDKADKEPGDDEQDYLYSGGMLWFLDDEGRGNADNAVNIDEVSEKYLDNEGFLLDARDGIAYLSAWSGEAVKEYYSYDASQDKLTLICETTYDTDAVVCNDGLYLLYRNIDNENNIFEYTAAHFYRNDSGEYESEAFAGDRMEKISDMNALLVGDTDAFIRNIGTGHNILLVVDDCLVAFDSEMNEIVTIMENYSMADMYVLDYDDNYVVLEELNEHYMPYGYVVYDMNNKTSSEVIPDKPCFNYEGYDNGKILYCEGDNMEYYQEGSVIAYDISTDSSSEVYSYKPVPGHYGGNSMQGSTVFIKGAVYYPYAHDGVSEWYKAEYKDGAWTSEPMSLEIISYGFAEYGKVTAQTDCVYCEYCGKLNYKGYAEAFELSDNYENADSINQLIRDEQNTFLENSGEMSEADDLDYCLELHCEEPYYSFSSAELKVADVRIIKEHYLVVVFNSSEYYAGAAHPYGYSYSLMYDINTGKEVILEDLYGGSEDSFKETVATIASDNYEEYSEAVFSDNAESFYSDIYDSTLLFGPVIYEEDGIAVLFTPYSVAPYASGTIEVFVSYDELGIEME